MGDPPFIRTILPRSSHGAGRCCTKSFPKGNCCSLAYRFCNTSQAPSSLFFYWLFIFLSFFPMTFLILPPTSSSSLPLSSLSSSLSSLSSPKVSKGLRHFPSTKGAELLVCYKAYQNYCVNFFFVNRIISFGEINHNMEMRLKNGCLNL